MKAILSRLFLLFLATFGLAWGTGFYRIQVAGSPFAPAEMTVWFVAAPALVMSAVLLGAWGWRHVRTRRQAVADAQAQQVQDQARQAAETRARQEDRRFDALALCQAELLLPAPSYAADFSGALAEAVPTAVPIEIDYEGDVFTLLARRIPHLSVPGELESFHVRTRRVAALCERILGQLALDRLGPSVDAPPDEVNAAEALTPYWEREVAAAVPQMAIRVLLDPTLMADARSLQAYLESRLPEFGLPTGWEVRLEIRLLNGVQALLSIDELISDAWQDPDQGTLLIAAHSEFDDDFLRDALQRSHTADPGQWQHQTQSIPSEGACALLLLPPILASHLQIPVRAHVKRPVALETASTHRHPERTLLHAALLRAAPDFDTAAPPASRIWFDADAPDAAFRRAILELNLLARSPAAAAFRPPTTASGEDEPPPEPDVLTARRVFGPLGAVNALSLLAAAAQAPAECSLIVAPESGAAAAIAVVSTPA